MSKDNKTASCITLCYCIAGAGLESRCSFFEEFKGLNRCWWTLFDDTGRRICTNCSAQIAAAKAFIKEQEQSE